MEMQTDIGSAYASACEQAARVIAAIRPDRLDLPTPCAKWNTRALLNHFIGSSLVMAAAENPETMAGADSSGVAVIEAMGDIVGDNPSAAYAEATAKAQRAFAAPGALDRIWKLPFGEMPGAVALNIHFMETLTHTWDLAKATGQIGNLDQDLAVAGDTVARGLVQPAFRNEQGDPFGPEVIAAPAAGPYERMMAFLGRNP